MVCYTINRTSQSTTPKKKTLFEVFWTVINGKKTKPDVSYLLILGSRCVTHVKKSHRVTGEKLDARGARSVFLGCRVATNKLVWILSGNRFLVSPHVITYQSIGNGLGWPINPSEVVRSLPSSVQRRLKARKTDYARSEDFKRTRSKPPSIVRGRGHPRRTLRRLYSENGSFLFHEYP